MIVVILSTVLVTSLFLIIGFWAWLELYMVYSTVVPISPSYHVAVLGEPTVSARLYWLGAPLVGSMNNLLVLTSKSSRNREFYFINVEHREIGLPDCPKYIPLLGSAVVDRATLVGFPLAGELKAEWKENDREVRIRITGFSDVALRSGLISDPDETAHRLIGCQREIILTKASKK